MSTIREAFDSWADSAPGDPRLMDALRFLASELDRRFAALQQPAPEPSAVTQDDLDSLLHDWTEPGLLAELEAADTIRNIDKALDVVKDLCLGHIQLPMNDQFISDALRSARELIANNPRPATDPGPDPLGALREAVETELRYVWQRTRDQVLDLPEWDQLRDELRTKDEEVKRLDREARAWEKERNEWYDIAKVMERERDEARARVAEVESVNPFARLVAGLRERIAELEARPFPDLMPIKDWLYEFEHSTSIPGEPQWVFERLRNLRRVLDSLPPAPGPTTWQPQPMSTAPRNGTPILVGNRRWIGDTRGGPDVVDELGWMPLPTPPKDKQG